jgi:hypothetical protein
MVRLLIVLFVFVSVSNAEAQQVYRTFVSQYIHNPDNVNSEGSESHWFFHYNDAGVMDSLRYSSPYSICEFGGLDKSKPFIKDLFDWETLPPNIGGLKEIIVGERRMVITEPKPGKIRVFASFTSGSDSLRSIDTLYYDYDTATLRLLSANRDTFSYEEREGKISTITMHSRGRIKDRWNFRRDDQGAIIGIEHFRSLLRDSLMLRAKYQILSWRDQIPPNSARRANVFFNNDFTHFPWIPEGEPGAWLEWTYSAFRLFGPTLHESSYDSLGRLISETGKEYRTIDYDASGPIKRDRMFDEPRLQRDVLLRRKPIPGGMYWDDFVLEVGANGYPSELRTHLFTYEYGYRYEDGLWGDRFSPDLVYEVNGDTINLRIEEPRSLKGLTACVIDTSEKEVAQIPISGRKTTFIFHPRPRTSYAIRWKYDGRKIVDQAF